MEAATPLPFAQVRVVGERLYVDGLVVDDETAVRLAKEAADAAKLVDDAIGIGSRILDREQTGAQVEVIKAELEKATQSAGRSLDETATRVKAEVDSKLAELLGPETGYLSRALARHFGDESSEAVQHKVRNVVRDVSAQMRDDLRKQFSSDSENNPLAGFQKASLAMIRQSADQQVSGLRAMSEKLEAMKVEIAELRAEKAKLEEVAAEADRGTAKGRPYEEAVHDAIDAIAVAQGDDCDAVGDVSGVGGKKGDVVVSIDACAGPARGRIVFEAKNAKRMSKREAFAYLDEAKATREADYAVLVVSSPDKLPAKVSALREFNGDKLFVVYDPDDGSRLALEVAYSLARARVAMKRGESGGVDPDALRVEIEKALGAMGKVSTAKGRLTQAKSSIDDAAEIVDELAAAVRAHLAQISSLLDDAEPEAA
jgi:hypothetical protein